MLRKFTYFEALSTTESEHLRSINRVRRQILFAKLALQIYWRAGGEDIRIFDQKLSLIWFRQCSPLLDHRGYWIQLATRHNWVPLQVTAQGRRYAGVGSLWSSSYMVILSARNSSDDIMRIVSHVKSKTMSIELEKGSEVAEVEISLQVGNEVKFRPFVMTNELLPVIHSTETLNGGTQWAPGVFKCSLLMKL